MSFILCLIIPLISLLPPFLPSASATSFFEAPFKESVQDARVFVRGIVGKSEVHPVPLPDGSQAPFTYWELRVTEVVKGEVKSPTIRFRQLGGEREGLGLNVSGGAEFSAGEEVVLMLDPPSAEVGDGAYPLRGLSTGKYTLQKGPDGKEYLNGSGIHFDSRNPDAKEGKITLEEVRKLVSSAPSAAASPAPARSPSPPSDEPLLRGRPLTPKPSPSLLAGEFDQPEADRTRSSRHQLWILVVGGFLGAWWYRRSRRR